MAARRGADRARRVIPRWIWWLVTAVPALFVLAGIGILAEAIIFTSEAVSARGEVVHVSRHYGGESGVTYTPTIRYRRDDGRTFEAETHMSSGDYDYAIGERVEILYSYDNPAEVRINSFFDLYGGGVILIVVGALFIRIITWVRRKIGRGLVLERVADSLTERMREAVQEHGAGAGSDREPDPRATDPSKPGHVHEPKPKRPPTVRRMR
ncbi:MAG: DUF3592 domain-containing protein [Paracoccaceae bacterium]